MKQLRHVTIITIALVLSLTLISPGLAQDTPDTAVPLTCESNGREVEGEPGTVQTVTCPADCTGSVWGTDIYSDDSSVCVAAQHAGTISAEGGIFNVTILEGQESYEATERNGIASFEWGSWERSFSAAPVLTYPISLTCESSGYDIEGDPGFVHTVVCPADCDGFVFGTGIYTDDSNVCTAAQHAGVISAEGDTLNVIFNVTILEGQESYEGSENNGIASSEWGSWSRSFSAAPITPPLALLTCDSRGSDVEGGVNTAQIVICSIGCTGPVWGTDIYSDDSSVCAAAQHAGVISSDGGIFGVTILEGQENYKATERNGIISGEWGSWERSFSVWQVVARVPLTCESIGQDIAGEPGTVRAVTCPADCTGSIWGTDIYSDDSSICVAAQHAGVISSSGGVFGVTILEGQESYESTERNGIISSEWGSWERSFSVSGN